MRFGKYKSRKTRKRANMYRRHFIVQPSRSVARLRAAEVSRRQSAFGRVAAKMFGGARGK